ncbi:MAG TPA: rhodanese-like domain-containing protein [Vicinamibacterales bacterium]|nr:rhodanese-like domain-containing protein [Vicinamibacterales bacterium]
MIKQVSVAEAHTLQQSGATYVDVRSTGEFADGHPAGAVNVPIFEPDEDSGDMMPNPDFVRVMKGAFPPDTKLLVGCQVGGRAVRAAQILASFGFTDLSVVRGGFGGARDAMGRTVDPGWADAGLPVATGSEDGGGYRDVVARADGEK